MSQTIAFVCAIVLSCNLLIAADAPASAPAEPDAVRLFRLRLTAMDDWYCFVAADPSIDTVAREEILRLFEARSRIIESEIDKIRENPPPLKELTARISRLKTELAKAPAEAQLLKGNPEARLRLERRTNVAMSIAMGRFEDRKELAAAAIKAGLPVTREDEALKAVDDAHQRFIETVAKYSAREKQISQLPGGEARQVAIETMQAEVQQVWFEMGRWLYLELRSLLRPDQYDAFDQAVPRHPW